MRKDALGLFWNDMPKMAAPPKEETRFVPPPQDWLLPTHLPYYEDSVKFAVPLMTDADLLQAASERHTLIYDIECYINYFLIAFKDVQTGKVVYFERNEEGYWNDNPAKLKWLIHNVLIVGFNSNNYDIAIANLAINNMSTAQMKAATNMLIGEKYKPWMVLRKLKLKNLIVDHIDIMEVAPQSGSLKIYAGRSACVKMQDLPFHPETRLSAEQIVVTRFYCVNDLDNTELLYRKLDKENELRIQMSAQYGVDLRSKSDAQIAEAVIGHELEKLSGNRAQKPDIPPGTAYKYKVPAYMSFQTPVMQRALALVAGATFVVGEDGTIDTPPELKKLKMEVGSSSYTLGIGGLHSNEKKAAHFSDANTILADVDVESYYPRIILNLGIYPQHLGPNFLKVFDTIVRTRLKAKHDHNKKVANSLKIVINGTFGKLGSKYSLFYSPDLLIQVTLTGQLSLLMLVEALELQGIAVVSGNTDGIVVKCPKHKLETRDRILEAWQKHTRFVLEETRYRALCGKDVNNYFAVKRVEDLEEGDDAVKRKGIYAKPNLSKNPTAAICSQAVSDFLSDGKPMEGTIRACTDPHLFMSVRNVAGGAVAVRYEDRGESNVPLEVMQEHIRSTGWVEYLGGTWIRKEWVNDRKPYEKMAVTTTAAYGQARWQPVAWEYLGKAVRWYNATFEPGVTQRLVNAANNNKVPKSDGCKPWMNMPKGVLPPDIDYQWYIDEAYRILKDIGYPL